MEQIGVDFSVDPSLPEMKNTLFVVDPAESFVINLTPQKTKAMNYNLPTYNVTSAPLQPRWTEENIVREDVREDVTEIREEVNFRSFIKTETSM